MLLGGLWYGAADLRSLGSRSRLMMLVVNHGWITCAGAFAGCGLAHTRVVAFHLFPVPEHVLAE
jgi:hypothetical protein